MIFLISLTAFGQSSRRSGISTEGHTIELRHNWQVQSGCKTSDGGEKISLPNYKTPEWLVTEVPSTVLAAQVNNHLFKNPFFGINLRSIPGTDYPIGKIYGYLPMTEDSPYRCAWWYRTEFQNPGVQKEKLWLHFDGINYRANVWFNGKRIANSSQVAGAFRSYEFDITDLFHAGTRNAIAIEVFAQSEKELGIDFLDWNPAPADKSLGLWRDVYIATSGPVTVRNPEILTHFVNDDLSEAELTTVVDVANHTDYLVSGTVNAKIGSIQLQQHVQLAPAEQRVVRFTPEQFPQLRVKAPRVWWPYQYGEPHLEQLRVAYVINGSESDSKTTRFGIREVQSTLDEKGFLRFRINRKNILIRGAGWAPDLFYRESHERLRQELTYVKHMNLNTIRLEGKLGSDDMFDLADEMGILIMAGWQCCDFWQHWEKWTPQDHEIAIASTYSQVSRLRSHPSVFVWLNGSDEVPPAQVEEDYIRVLRERDWPNPFMSAAADRTSTVTGRTGVKMSGPYDYVPPEYWYLDTAKFGGAFGFNTETSAGPAVPSAADVRRTLPKQSWWPVDEQWNFHAGLGKFAQYNIFTEAMTATYGEANDLEDYSRKAQLMTYDGERAMFEAYGANKYTSTGVIQWMLNNAWPSFIWHLYDYYLVPGGGYFGTRKANEPLHVQYRYDDRSIIVVNSSLAIHRGLHVVARVVGLDGQQQFSNEVSVDVTADGVASAFAVPQQSSTTFLKLELSDSRGKIISDNFYWLPAKLAQLEWGKSNYYYTPAVAYADMRDLAQISKGSVRASARHGKKHGEALVSLKNEGSSVAFFLHLRAVKSGTDEDIAPVSWNDNFVSLLPGESRVLAVKVAPLNMAGIEIKLDGWNVQPQTLRVAAAAITVSNRDH